MVTKLIQRCQFPFLTVNETVIFHYSSKDCSFLMSNFFRHASHGGTFKIGQKFIYHREFLNDRWCSFWLIFKSLRSMKDLNYLNSNLVSRFKYESSPQIIQVKVAYLILLCVIWQVNSEIDEIRIRIVCNRKQINACYSC